MSWPKSVKGKLYEVTDRLKKPVFEEELTEELLGGILPAKQNPERIGKDHAYPVTGSLTWLYENQRGDAVTPMRIAGY